MKSKYFYFLLAFTLLGQLVYAQQQEYKISIELDNISDSLCYLVRAYGDTHIVVDTAEVDSGSFTFKGDNKLPDAIYAVIGSSKNKYMDLVITSDQKFSIKGDIKELTKTVKIKGSDENKKFYKYIEFITEKREEITSLKDSISKIKNNEILKTQLNKKLSDIDAKVSNYQTEFIKKEFSSFLGKFILGTIPVTVPPSLDSATQQVRYNYYKAHYWDNIDFSDNRMLSTPYFYGLWESYFDNVVFPIPDSINLEIDHLFSQMEESGEMYNYLLGKTIYKYETSNRMGFDAVFVHIALNYFKKGKTAKFNETVVKNVIEKAESLNKILIGKPVPNLIAQDSTKTIKKLRNVDATYTLLVFWDSECGHCKKELPKINEFYIDNKEKLDLEVYAVSTDTTVAKWKNFLNKKEYDWINVLGMWSAAPFFKDVFDINSTPILFMIDEDKKIIAKKFGADDIEKVIEFDQKKKGELLDKK